MKVGQNFSPKSSFLSTDKDLSLIVKKMLDNQRLCKLLYYTQKDCLKAPDLTMEQRLSMLDKQIKLVPKLEIVDDCPNYVIVTFDNFSPNATNPEFRDCSISFDILCHPDHWNLGNFQLRHHKIAGEIDAMINKQKLTGIGEVSFVSGSNLLLNDQLMGISLIYQAIHGIEDEIDPLTAM